MIFAFLVAVEPQNRGVLFDTRNLRELWGKSVAPRPPPSTALCQKTRPPTQCLGILGFALFLRIGEARSFQLTDVLKGGAPAAPRGAMICTSTLDADLLVGVDNRPKGARAAGQKQFAPCIDQIAVTALEEFQKINFAPKDGKTDDLQNCPNNTRKSCRNSIKIDFVPKD